MFQLHETPKCQFIPKVTLKIHESTNLRPKDDYVAAITSRLLHLQVASRSSNVECFNKTKHVRLPKPSESKYIRSTARNFSPTSSSLAVEFAARASPKKLSFARETRETRDEGNVSRIYPKTVYL